MHPTRSFTLSCLALIVLVAFSGQAFAGAAAVGLCSAAGTHYTTIQAAVNAAELLAPPTQSEFAPALTPSRS
jgi:hypothetical protein